MKIKVDPQMTIATFLLRYGSLYSYEDSKWQYAYYEGFFRQDEGGIFLVPKEEVPDHVVEDLKIDPVL